MKPELICDFAVTFAVLRREINTYHPHGKFQLFQQLQTGICAVFFFTSSHLVFPLSVLRPETESCAEQELPVPLQISLNLLSDGLVSSGRNLCVLFLALCAEIWRRDHIICICIMWWGWWAGLQGWCGSGVLDTHQNNCSTTGEHLAGLLPSRTLPLCQCDWSDLCSEWEIGSNSISSKVGEA